MALFKNVDGKRVLMPDDEEAATRAQWAANDAALIAEQLQKEKELHKEKLRREKIDQMLAPQIAQIDAATDSATIKKVKI